MPYPTQPPRLSFKRLAIVLLTVLTVIIFALIVLAPAALQAARPNAPQPPAQNIVPLFAPDTLYHVNSLVDDDDGFCQSWTQTTDCTLREAIYAANAHAGADNIEFDVAGTITLLSTLPNISSSLTIDAKTLKVTLDGNSSRRILVVNSGYTLTVNHLAFKNGVTNTTLTWGASGGAIYSSGTLNVYNSVFYDNTAGDYGGAVFSEGTTTITNSTFVGNSADQGGAVLVVNQNLSVGNSTFQNNSAGSGAGIYNQGTLYMSNTIIADSTGPDCTNNGTIGLEYLNLITDTGAAACGFVHGLNGDLIGVNPLLGALKDNGGPTFTSALGDGSPAIDIGNISTCASPPVNGEDQRGVARPLDGNGDGTPQCDLGAYEAPTKATPTPTLTTTKTNSPSPTATQTMTITPTLTPTQTPTATQIPCTPSKPTLLKPAKGAVVTKAKVKFDWTDTACTAYYLLLVANTKTGDTTLELLTLSQGKQKLAHGKYKWYVKACNVGGDNCISSKRFKLKY